MPARFLAILMTLNLVAPSQGQALELGVLTGSLGQGISLSSAVSDQWRVHVRGSYQTRDTSRPYSSGGLRFASRDRTMSGAVSISVDRKLTEQFGLTAGVWTLVAERKLGLEPLSGLIAGTELSADEIGTISVEVSLPQQPVPYLGAYRTARVFRNWAARIDMGVVYAGRHATETRATGRLSPTVSWLRETENALSPSRLIPVIQLGLSMDLNAPTR